MRKKEQKKVFEPNEKVKIKAPGILSDLYQSGKREYDITEKMLKYGGMITRVVETWIDQGIRYYSLEIDDMFYRWHEDLIIPYSNERIACGLLMDY